MSRSLLKLGPDKELFVVWTESMTQEFTVKFYLQLNFKKLIKSVILSNIYMNKTTFCQQFKNEYTFIKIIKLFHQAKETYLFMFIKQKKF